MKKTFLSVLIYISLLITSFNSAFGVEQQDITNEDVVALKEAVALQQQKIGKIESDNQQLLNGLKQLSNDQKTSNSQTEKQISNIVESLTDVNSQLANHKQSLSEIEGTVRTVNQNLKKDIDGLSEDTNAKTSELENKILTYSLYGVLALVGLLALLGIIYWYLRKKFNQGNEGLAHKVQAALDNVKKAEENIVESDTNLVTQLNEVLAQIKLDKNELIQAQALAEASKKNFDEKNEVDHSLAIKLADEIHRMRRRINALPIGAKGLKSLSKSLERLEDKLQEKGYEIIDYTGMNYIEGMTLKARFIPSDDLDDGQSIITRVVYPQVNYNDKLIQKADVEVSVG